MSSPVRILHLHSVFNLGGKEARAVRLMAAWGDRAVHTIVSGVPEALSARDAIPAGIAYEIAQDPPPLTGKPSVARFEAFAKYMRRFDLVLTYNWGAIDGVMARRAFAKGAPPLVHHEDGFNEDEAGGLKAQRNIYRRIALPAAHALAVPSRTLEKIATETWKQPAARVHRIVNGIDTAAYAVPVEGAIPGFKRRPGETVIGTLAGLRTVKDLPMLVRAVGGLAGRVRLVIVGEGSERERIAGAAAAMGLTLGDQLLMPGFLPEPHRYIGLFDVFALSSLSEQFPIGVVEAMAAGLPVAAVAVGDVATMTTTANAPYITYRDEVFLRDALSALVAQPELRRQIGTANQARARAEYDEATMIARYRALYEGALGRPGALTP